MARADRLLSRIEAMNVRGTEGHWALIPAEVARRCRAQTVRIGDALATLMPTSDSLHMNRVIGLGHRGGADASTIDALVERYRAAKVRRFSVLLSPGRQAAALARCLEARGFIRRPGHALLLRDCGRPVERVATTLKVVREAARLRRAAIGILGESFAMPASRATWYLAARSRDGYEHFLALDGSRPVAVGSLWIEGDLAWLGGAATRTPWRRRGAQSALIAVRLRRAARRGCRWAWSETAEPVRGRPDGSRRNMLRHGFAQACLKAKYVWQER